MDIALIVTTPNGDLRLAIGDLALAERTERRIREGMARGVGEVVLGDGSTRLSLGSITAVRIDRAEPAAPALPPDDLPFDPRAAAAGERDHDHDHDAA